MPCFKVAVAVFTLTLMSIGAVAQEGGSVTGTITYEGTLPGRQALKISKDPKICGAEAHYDESLLVGENRGLQNAVVSIINAPAGGDLKTLGSEFSLHQTGCVFVPHIQMVPVNVEVVTFNDDGILHNIHSESKKNRPFNISQPKYKKRIRSTFSSPEKIFVKCDVHGWMSAYIVAVDHPYHAITNRNGGYTIPDLPPGTYQVEFWHEKLGNVQREIAVESGTAAALDVVLSAAEN